MKSKKIIIREIVRGQQTTVREVSHWIPKSDPINCPKSCEDGEQF